MAVVPANEFGRAYNARQILAFNAEFSVERRTYRQYDRVIKSLKVVNRHIATDVDIANETNGIFDRDLVVPLGNRL